MSTTIARIAAATALALSAVPAGAITTAIDDLHIVRSGSTFFRDTFGDGIPPPLAEANTTVCGALAPNCYSVTGTYPAGAESSGKLQMNSAYGGASQNASGAATLIQQSRLQTNRDDSSPSSGLKIGLSFSATAVFDLVGTGPGDAYGIRFSDFHANAADAGHRTDFLQLQVRTSTDPGAVAAIEFRKQDFQTGNTPLIDSRPLNLGSGADQIRLTLDHPTADSNQVFASWAYLQNGSEIASGSFAEAGTMFTGETWTRVDFYASALNPIPEPETYALMLGGLGLLAWRLGRRSKPSFASAQG